MTALAADAERSRQQKTEAFGELLRPGTLFTGVMHTTRGDAHTVVIEVTEHHAATQRVTALLRTEGGWADARAFRGEWSLDAESGTCALALRSRSEDRIANAGPLLEEQKESEISLELRADGTISGKPGQWQLHRVEAATVAAVKADLSSAIAPVLAATQAGKIYRGTATRPGASSNAPPVTYELLLRFIAQDPASLTLRASLEAPNFARASRAFHGTIVDNTYRAGSTPIRLLSSDNDRVRQADASSPLGLNTASNNLTLALRVDGTRLLGQDGRFSYEFELSDAARGASAPDARTQTLDPALRSSAQDPRSQILDPAAARSALTGVPDFSALPGPAAYALVDGHWARLPDNNGRLIQSQAQSLTVKLIEFKMWQDRQAGINSEPSKDVVADLTFDGKDAVPVVPSNEVVLLYIGRVSVPSVKDMEQYPVLREAPAIELAPTQTRRNGARAASVYVIAPGYLGFGPNRVTATIDQPAKDVTLLRRPAPLPAGRYALSCGSRCYEVVVK